MVSSGRNKLKINDIVLEEARAHAEAHVECPICYCLWENPVQTECHHIFCEECVSSVLACPTCRQPFGDNKPKPLKESNPWALRQLNGLKVCCPYADPAVKGASEGCSTLAPNNSDASSASASSSSSSAPSGNASPEEAVAESQSSLAEQGSGEDESTSGNGESQSLSSQPSTGLGPLPQCSTSNQPASGPCCRNSDTPSDALPTNELYCSWVGSYGDLLAKHLGECRFHPVPCPRACGEVMKRRDLVAHEKRCPKLFTQCTVCGEWVKPGGMQEHDRQNAERHVDILLKEREERNERMQLQNTFLALAGPEVQAPLQRILNRSEQAASSLTKAEAYRKANQTAILTELQKILEQGGQTAASLTKADADCKASQTAILTEVKDKTAKLLADVSKANHGQRTSSAARFAWVLDVKKVYKDVEEHKGQTGTRRPHEDVLSPQFYTPSHLGPLQICFSPKCIVWDQTAKEYTTKNATHFGVYLQASKPWSESISFAAGATIQVLRGKCCSYLDLSSLQPLQMKQIAAGTSWHGYRKRHGFAEFDTIASAKEQQYLTIVVELHDIVEVIEDGAKQRSIAMQIESISKTHARADTLNSLLNRIEKIEGSHAKAEKLDSLERRIEKMDIDNAKTVEANDKKAEANAKALKDLLQQVKNEVKVAGENTSKCFSYMLLAFVMLVLALYAKLSGCRQN
ncbi:unnamed protein product [Amoebophrya sp. A120]|nr:unnamed protein product [Amoebophrya sp. A120]|eukprot:GSA120T00011939001.1